MRFLYAIAPATILGPLPQNGPQDSFHMEILCFYVNSAFGEKFPPQLFSKSLTIFTVKTLAFVHLSRTKARNPAIKILWEVLEKGMGYEEKRASTLENFFPKSFVSVK